jgi:hypothetical protein
MHPFVKLAVAETVAQGDAARSEMRKNHLKGSHANARL